MGGMCLGSLLLPRVVSPRAPSAARLRSARARHRRLRPAAAVRDAARRRSVHRMGRRRASPAFCCAAWSPRSACCRRRSLMGATLPAIARWVETTPRGRVVARLLLRRQHRRRACSDACSPASICCACYDMAIATYVAVAINVDRRGRWRSLHRAGAAPDAASADAESRVEQPRSAEASSRLRRDRAVGLCGARRGSDLDAAAVAAVRRDGLHVLAHSGGLPARPRHRQQRRFGAGGEHRAHPRSRSAGVRCCCAARSRGRRTCSRSRCRTGRSIRRSRAIPGSTFRSISCGALWAVLPAAVLWGASFPLALASVASEGQDPGRLVGGVYAANTVGAIIGALAASLLLVVVARSAARAAGAR